MKVIDIDGLTRDYGGGRGIFDLCLSVRQGECFGFLGPNGAGKTTTIRHLMGFIRPLRGQCRINGLDCWKEAPRIQKQLGYIPGEISFWDDMTGEEFLRFMARYRGMNSMGRAPGLIERFDLDPKSRLRSMSKGTRQKVGIVAAFMHDPALLLLDEPTSGLDPLMQNRFIGLIAEEKARGKTILLSSHMFEEVERTCTRVAILRRGRLAAVEAIESLKASRHRTYTVTLETSEAAARFGASLHVLHREGAHVTVEIQNDLHAFLAELAQSPVTGLDSVSQSLEEVFLHYYGGEAQ